MSRLTGGYFGVNEALFSSALAALVFSIFAAQPLTLVGITGLISLFNYTIYDIMKEHNLAIYPQVIAWTSIWAAIAHWVVSFGNLCDYMRFVTDYSSNAFGMYVGIIYVEKGVQELVSIFVDGTLAQGYLSVVIAICFMLTVYGLEFVGSTTLFKPWMRSILADYAYPIGTLFWTGFSHIPGRIKRTELPRLPVTRAFYPTVDRSWLVDFWTLEVKWVFVSLPMGILLMLLFYYDHNVSSITAQAKQYPLKKPAGFHWDFFLLGCTSFIGGIVGIPLPNGLVPQVRETFPPTNIRPANMTARRPFTPTQLQTTKTPSSSCTPTTPTAPKSTAKSPRPSASWSNACPTSSWRSCSSAQ